MSVQVPDKVRAAFQDRSTLTVPELARSMEMDVKTLRRHIRDGQMPCHLKGTGSVRRHVVFTLSDVAAFYNATSSEPQAAQEPVPEPPRPRRRIRKLTGKPTPGFIYYVSNGEFIKIGWSRNWKKRVGSLQTAFPHKLDVLLVHAGTKHEELKQHLVWERLLVQGEWHRRDPLLLAHIEKLRSDGADVR